MTEKYKFRVRCLNRTHPNHFDDETYLCSRHGQVVDIQCCIECEAEMLATPEEKIEKQIKLNNRIIDYNLKEIGRLRVENSKLEDKLFFFLRNKTV